MSEYKLTRPGKVISDLLDKVDSGLIYVTTLNFFGITNGMTTTNESADYLEALNIVEQWKSGKLVIVKNMADSDEVTNGLCAFGILNVYYEYRPWTVGHIFAFTIINDNSMKMKRYSLSGMRWTVEEVGGGVIDLTYPRYDITNFNVTFVIGSEGKVPITGVYLLEGTLTVTYSEEVKVNISEVINIGLDKRRKPLTIMNDDGGYSSSFFLDYSSSLISLTNMFELSVDNIIATDFKLIKL